MSAAKAKAKATAADGRGPVATFTKRWQLCAALLKMGRELEALPPDNVRHLLAPLVVEFVLEELRGLGHIFERA